MPQATLSKSSLAALHTTLGPVKKSLDDEVELYGGNAAQLERIKKTIGLSERYVAPVGVTALDLCEQAVRKALAGAGEAPEGLDAVLFVTQTPDHFQPCNAALLHGRLKLPKSCAAFDVNLGCSGWVYGLYIASLMIEAGGCKKVLLAAGDTISQCVHPRDRAVAPLFGDAGSATLLVRNDDAAPTAFDLHSDGSGSEAIRVPHGGFRKPIGPESAVETSDEDGNTRTPANLCMNGAEVFNFSIKEEPEALRQILAYAGVPIDQIDWVLLHQANRYIIGNIARRLKLPVEKAPSDAVEKYGNQSSASIPGIVCDLHQRGLLKAGQQVVFSGFGVGLSWASALTRFPALRSCGIDVFTPKKD